MTTPEPNELADLNQRFATHCHFQNGHLGRLFSHLDAHDAALAELREMFEQHFHYLTDSTGATESPTFPQHSPTPDVSDDTLRDLFFTAHNAVLLREDVRTMPPHVVDFAAICEGISAVRQALTAAIADTSNDD